MTGTRKPLPAGFHRKAFGLLGGLMVFAGCATGGSPNPFAGVTNTDTYVLRVESRYLYEVSVFVNPSGKRLLVGRVPPRGLEFFDFEYPSGKPLNVELEGEMGDRYRLPAQPVFGGGRIYLVIASDLRRSGFVRR